MHPYVAVPVTSALVWRAYSRRSLTPAGIVVAALTAVIHAIHPWSIFFTLLGVFFIGGTAVTKVLPEPGKLERPPANFPQVKHDVKARLTLSSSGSSGGEGARTHIQVLANSGIASLLILLHYWQLRTDVDKQDCWRYGQDPLVVGIVRYYGPRNTRFPR